MKTVNLLIFRMLCLGMLATCSTAWAAGGDLDNSFGTNGIAITPVGSSNDSIDAIAVQPDGKIVAVGNANNGLDRDVAVVRYNADGSLDTNFGNGGKVITAIGNKDDEGNAVTIQSNGKIVVAGYSNNGSNNDIAVIRYNSNGSLDNTFGSGGIVTTAIGTGNDGAYFGIEIQTDDKIVVAGYSNNGSNDDFAVVRYNADGSLDNSFSGDGKVTTAIGTGTDVSYTMALQTDGKIIAAGYSNNGLNDDFALVRYNTDGSLDTSFGSGGKVTTAIGSNNEAIRSIAIQPDGKIVGAGSSYSALTNWDTALVRYNTDGTLDNSFGISGKVITVVGNDDDGAFNMVLKSDGSIIQQGEPIVVLLVSLQFCVMINLAIWIFPLTVTA